MAKKKNSNGEKGQASKKNKNSNKKISKSESKFKKFTKRAFITLFTLGIICFVIGLGYVFAIIKNTPPLDVQSVLTLSEPTRLYDVNGEFMDNRTSDKIREKVDSDKIPKTLKDAYVSIEDERFYNHKGIDVKRILGAFVADVKYLITGNGGIQGGSTITQQLIKNTLLSNERKIERKIREIYLSLELEKNLNKDEVLTAYLNTIPLSGKIYGVQAASKYFFNKDVSELSLVQCAYLAGLTQAPTTYSAFNPNNAENPKYVPRTITVLGKMLEHGKITQEQYNESVELAKDNNFEFHHGEISYSYNYEWFTRPTIIQVQQDLKTKYKYTDEEVKNLLNNGGLKIYTTMDRSIQDSTQEILNNRKNIAVNGSNEPVDANGVPLLQTAAVIIDNATAEVRALVGGRGNQPALSSNRAFDTYRSIGSTAKPITAYGPAIDTKVLTTASLLDDTPYPYPNSNKVNNFDFRYTGNMSLRDALVQSKNTLAVYAANKIGKNTALSYGEKLGLKYGPGSLGPSAFGLGEFHNDPNNPDGGNVYTLAGAYATFANNGVYRKPKLYTKVEDSSGNIILGDNKEETKVFSPQTSFIITDILKGTSWSVSSTIAPNKSIPVAGKTGTSENTKDLWYAGYSPYYTGAVWIGYDNQASLSGSSSAARKLWGKIMVKPHEGKESKSFSKPSGITSASFCIDSGKKPSELCANDPRGSRIRTDYFISGTEPKDICDSHVKVTVNSENNKIATDKTPARLRVDKIFIKKDNPNSTTADYKYLVPKEFDDTVYEPEPPVVKPEDPNNPNQETPPTEDEDNEDNENIGNNENNQAGDNSETTPAPNDGNPTNGSNNIQSPTINRINSIFKKAS